MSKPVYVLGTGLSHDGSAVLLENGRVRVGIEKERVTRRKHDGGNDAAAVAYCLDAAGITLADVDLIVQNANFEIPRADWFEGPRPFGGPGGPPVEFISHHLAHAWSAAGTTGFGDCAIMVIDGCGSPYDQCVDLAGAQVLTPPGPGMWCEKDSFYRFDGREMHPLVKDFSQFGCSPGDGLALPTTRHSIGGFYSAISKYVFGNMDDAGKLMGLAPYGSPGAVGEEAFTLEDGRILVTKGWQKSLARPASGYEDFRANFEYYADVARWAQDQVELAVSAVFQERLGRFPAERVAYTGGVALNAVANARLLDDGVVRDLYMEPAAGDNGLALGCAYYGWLKLLGGERAAHDGSTCFGRSYSSSEIAAALADALADAGGEWEITPLAGEPLVERAAALLAAGKTLAWFRDGSEFGPRALGHRSILAHPGIPGMRDHINAAIKFREDFRPFAPAVSAHRAPDWFEAGRDSPYMILVDRTRPHAREALANVTHVNGTARVQTVEPGWNPLFHRLVEAFGALSGIPVLLNTSLNRRGMPIVETPREALALFAETALDALVLQDFLVLKR
ncbi:MAG: transferase [Sphingomonadales bacterium]|nr:transferase [Sphingomonadales bacterium]MBD3773198.1 transferase [Paracoccaceae bacterium]